MIKKICETRDRRRRYRLGKWGFENGKPDKRDPDKPIAVPFQAADFLAYETYRHLGNRVVSGVKRNKVGEEIPVRKAYQELVGGRRPAQEKPPHYTLYYDKRLIRLFLDNLNKLESKLRPES